MTKEQNTINEIASVLGITRDYVTKHEVMDRLAGLVARVSIMDSTLLTCADRFHEYGAIHAAKPDPVKAAANYEMAKQAQGAAIMSSASSLREIRSQAVEAFASSVQRDGIHKPTLIALAQHYAGKVRQGSR